MGDKPLTKGKRLLKKLFARPNCAVCKKKDCKCPPKEPSLPPSSSSMFDDPLEGPSGTCRPRGRQQSSHGQLESRHCECTACSRSVCRASKYFTRAPREHEYRCCRCTRAGYGYPGLVPNAQSTPKASVRARGGPFGMPVRPHPDVPRIILKVTHPDRSNASGLKPLRAKKRDTTFSDTVRESLATVTREFIMNKAIAADYTDSFSISTSSSSSSSECNVCKQKDCLCDSPGGSPNPRGVMSRRPVPEKPSPMELGESGGEVTVHCTCTKCVATTCEAQKGCTGKPRKDEYRCCSCTKEGYGFPRRPMKLPPTARESFAYLAEKKKRDDTAVRAIHDAFSDVERHVAEGTHFEVPEYLTTASEWSGSSSSEESSSDEECKKGHCACERCYNTYCKMGEENEAIATDDLRCCDCVRKLGRSPQKLTESMKRMYRQHHRMAQRIKKGKMQIISTYDSLGLRQLDDSLAIALLEKAKEECRVAWAEGKKIVPEELKLIEPPSLDDAIEQMELSSGIRDETGPSSTKSASG